MSNEYQYALLLSIRNAKIFHKQFYKDSHESNDKNDRVFNENGDFNLRTENQWINQFEYDKQNKCYQFKFNDYFINNILRVLCGQRPISRYRTKYHYIANFNRSIDEKIQEISSRTLTKFDNIPFLKEKSTVQKVLDNSWGNLIPTWEYIKIYLHWYHKNDLFDKFINLSCNPYTNKYDVIKNKTLYEYMQLLGESLNNLDVKVFLDEIKNDKDIKSNYKKFFLDANSSKEYKDFFYEKNGFHLGFTNASLFYKKYILKACSEAFFVNGQLIVLLKNNEEKQLFTKGIGVASIFDNGLVTIEKLLDLSKINLDVIRIGYSQCEAQNVLSI